MSETRVIVADDQAMIREALATLVDLEEGYTVVGKAAHGYEVIDSVEALGGAVDVVVMDVEMPGLDGLTTCAALKRRFPHLRVLIVTTFARPGYVHKAIEAGADGYIIKDSPLPQLISALEKVAAGETVIDQELAVQTLTWGRSPLTQRECEVLSMLRTGCSIEDVAAGLGLSPGTVRNYVSAAIDKVGASTRGAAMRIAEERGWLDL